MLLNDKQRELVNRIDCSMCRDRRSCDQIRYECPKVDIHTLQVDDVSILKSEIIKKSEQNHDTDFTKTTKREIIKKSEQNHDTDFTKTTKREFETHMYGNISRCCYKNKILSFFASEKEAQGQFFFSHNERYYKALREKSLTDGILEQQIMNFLYPDNKSFVYRGWLCKYITNDGLFHLFTPNELEQPAGFRNPEMEVSTPAQAIEFINCY